MMESNEYVRAVAVVDDDHADLEFFIEAFKKVDPSAKVHSFDMGSEFLLELELGKIIPDIVFVDVHMPHMDGESLVKAVRSLDRFARTPLIVYSTSCDGQLLEKFKNIGATMFLGKADTFDSLILGIKRTLGSIDDAGDGAEVSPFLLKC